MAASLRPSSSPRTRFSRRASIWRLGAVAYRLQASFLPGHDSRVERKLDALSMAELDLSSPTVLEKGCVYLAPTGGASSAAEGGVGEGQSEEHHGRLDVFTLLITDGGVEFERVPDGYSGPLFAEIVPRTFSVIVQQGCGCRSCGSCGASRRPRTACSCA